MQNKGSYDDKPALEYLFHPRSIAIAGVSTDLTRLNPGRLFLDALIGYGFKGKLYPINRNGGEIYGLKCYPSILDIPDTVDYVISAVPAQYTPQLIADSATKGARAIHLFTAGFTESGDEERKQLELQIATIARQKGIRIIGPNCMGLYCPKTKLTFHPGLPKKSGSVGFIVQSGGNAIYGIREANTRGIQFSKVISYGNGTDLNETDFLEYLTDDAETRVIAIYIEGVKDGHRFMEALRKATQVKPVIIYKGGVTETGVRTAASHTSAIAGQDRIWHSLLTQVGAIQVDSIEELNDLLLLFTFMSPPGGRNTAIIGIGGGASVNAADVAARAGLVLKPFPAEITEQLREYFRTAGNIFTNPMDMSSAFAKEELIQKAIKIIADGKQLDVLIIHIPFDIYSPIAPKAQTMGPYVESVLTLGKDINKRTAVVLHYIASDKSKQLAHQAQSLLHQAGFPIFPSIGRAVTAISKYIQYHQRDN